MTLFGVNIFAWSFVYKNETVHISLISRQKKKAMTLCGVIILTVPLSMKMKLSMFLPNCHHNRTVPTGNQ
jgi:23S rRNA A2030 N6-methylase RlmJ